MTGTTHYWDTRSTAAYEYHGELFYTITPIAYYYERRRRIVEQLVRAITHLPHTARILDYGCGDGAYLRMLQHQRPASYFGCDISEGFINRAHDECSADVRLSVMQAAQIPFDTTFECIYCSAVLAHILDDNMLAAALRDLRAHLASGGVFYMAEATAWWRRNGPTWTRRTPSDYCRMITDAGFRVIARRTLAYPLFFYYDALLLPLVRVMAFRGTREERMLQVNRSAVMRACNGAIMSMARHLCVPWLTPTHTTLITAVIKD